MIGRIRQGKNKAMRKIDTNIVAFDFFDTIVHRNCHPEEVLYEWAKKCSRIFNFKVKAKDIYMTRKQVEQSEKDQDFEEVSYRSLISKTYNRLTKICQNALDITENDFYEFSLRVETEIEINKIYLDSNTVTVIKKNYKDGKKIILISDFYMGIDFFERVLSKFNIRKFFSEIFISSELGKRKASGNLYKMVCNIIKCQPKDITMCGDNYVSDYKVPKSLGMKAIYLKFESRQKVISENELNKVYKRLTHKNQKDAPFNGYISEILYFLSKLYEEVIKEGVDTILFCSREGQFLKTLFDKYQIILWGEIYIKSIYFYVSRKSVLVPSLRKIEEENFDLIFRQYKKLTLFDFMKNIGFEEPFIAGFCKKNKIDYQDTISVNLNNQLLLQLKNSTEFKEEYNRIRNMQKKYFLKYISECGDVLEKKKVILVDVGWKGTIQDCIRRILPRDIVVKGYYIGLRTGEYGCNDPDTKKGILFSDYPQLSPNYKLLEHEYMFYEWIFTANHGPVIGYEKNKKGQIIPQIQDNENERALYDYINRFQNTLIDTFEEVVNLYKKTYFLPGDLYDLMIKNALWRTCVDYPQIWKIKEEIKLLVTENFGIGDVNKKNSWILIFKRFCNNPFSTTDFSIRVIEKLHLSILLPMVKVYCKYIYLIRVQKLDR